MFIIYVQDMLIYVAIYANAEFSDLANMFTGFIE